MKESHSINVPKHVAFIMDGNGRWAKRRFLPRTAGHHQGAKTIKRIAMHAHKIGVQVMTVYAFSTENWGRPKEEVNYLMRLPLDFFNTFLPELIENNVRVSYLGQIERLPKETRNALLDALEKTKNNTGLLLNFAVNYGGRDEIVEAVRNILKDYQKESFNIDELDAERFEDYLSTASFKELADPDLVIRTSGEQRLSNFLLWQIAYSEFYFTDKLWPDFNEDDFDEAVESYAKRYRRFGKLT